MVIWGNFASDDFLEQRFWTESSNSFLLIQTYILKDLLEETREKRCIFPSSVKPFDLSEATKLSLVLSASQQINQQQLKDSFMKNFGRYSSDFDDTDSRFSFSSSSSPVHVSSFMSKFVWANSYEQIFIILQM